LLITLVFEKNANFFAENCQKSQKIGIITSTSGSLKIEQFKNAPKKLSSGMWDLVLLAGFLLLLYRFIHAGQYPPNFPPGAYPTKSYKYWFTNICNYKYL
jgi:hypothetical protein